MSSAVTLAGAGAGAGIVNSSSSSRASEENNDFSAPLGAGLAASGWTVLIESEREAAMASILAAGEAGGGVGAREGKCDGSWKLALGACSE